MTSFGPRKIVLPAGAAGVPVKEIPRLIALALYPEYGALGVHAEIEHWQVLDSAIRAGEIIVRSPLTMIPNGSATGVAFSSDVVSVPDLTQYVAPFGLTLHIEDRGGLTPIKRAALLRKLGRKYPQLENAIRGNQQDIVECRIPARAAPGGKGGYYYLEKVVRVCEARWEQIPEPTGIERLRVSANEKVNEKPTKD